MATHRNFHDRVVMITGAAGGLGRAFSRRFGRTGAKLSLADLDPDGLDSLASDLRASGVECVTQVLDVTDESACRRAVERTVDHFGRLDVLINNAGITCRSPFQHIHSDTFRQVMAVNLYGAVYCTQAALDQLIRNQGLIIVISSIAGFSPVLGRSAYSASKHALHGLFDTLRTELLESGVGVTIVCPGFTDTHISVNALDGDGSKTSHPQSTVGRVATPDSVAEAVFRAARRDQRLLVLSSMGRLTRLMTKFCPGLYERLMAKSLASELDR